MGDIKKAYHKHAMKNHPDQNPNADKDKFKEVTAAYNVLSKEDSKKQYDQMR